MKTPPKVLWPLSPSGAFVSDDHGLPAVWLPADFPRESRPSLPQPFFLLGNHELTAFLSADGGLSLFTMDRAAARLNPGQHPAEGNYSSRITVRTEGAETVYDLRESTVAGRADRIFGCGCARYRHNLGGGLIIERRWHTAPSENPSDGCPALLLVMEVRNDTGRAVEIEWSEQMTAAYDMGFWHNAPCRHRRARYGTAVECGGDFSQVSFQAVEESPFVFDGTGADSYADGSPPCIRWHGADAGLWPIAEPCTSASARAGMCWRVTLPPGGVSTARVVVSVAREASKHAEAAARLLGHGEAGLRTAWSRRIPAFDGEADPARRAEMRWHFAVLHMMANRHAATGETYVPQGTVYEYALGCSAVIRDHLAHALPLCHCDPDLARSVLRFAAKLMGPDGSLRSGLEGAGRIPLGPDQKSDSQLYFLWLLCELLETNPDPRELVAECSPMGDLLEHAVRAFVHLRDVVGTGPHGLVRVLCSDWNDLFYQLVGDRPYHHVFADGESHLNTAMAIVVLGKLRNLLASHAASLPGERRSVALRLAEAAGDFRIELLDSFLNDWGEHAFPARARVGEFFWGRESMVAEAMGWTLQIDELPMARRMALWHEVRSRLLEGEPKGIRQAESPTACGAVRAGERENGGFWFALHGPLTAAVASLDPAAGEELAERMGLRGHAERLPGEWIGAWSGPDSFNSPAFGLPCTVAPYVHPFPLYCAHAHAWPLWSALRAQGRSVPSSDRAAAPLDHIQPRAARNRCSHITVHTEAAPAICQS